MDEKKRTPAAFIYTGRVFCGLSCAINALADPPTEKEWRHEATRVKVPVALVPFVTCYACGLDMVEAQ